MVVNYPFIKNIYIYIGMCRFSNMYQKKQHIFAWVLKKKKKKKKGILESDILGIVFFSAYTEFGLRIPLNRFMWMIT